MPRKKRKATVPAVPQTHSVQPRCIQTSGIFSLPTELIDEILAYFGDPHRNIRSAKEARMAYASLDPDNVERLTVTRILTMTCWHLRNMLFPLLWKYVEGCCIYYRRGNQRKSGNGLYAQCVYLVLNPTVGAYVQALSVDLQFSKTTKDLMTKFVKCLGRLPNLRTLEVSSTTAFAPVTRRLKRRCARFPSVLQLGISDTTVKFVRSCPNVESIAISDELSSDNIKVLGSYIRERSEKSRFKRLIGVNKFDVHQVVQDCSDLQEIGISESGFAIRPVTEAECSKVAGHLRLLKHLAVVELHFPNIILFEATTAECRRRRAEIQTELNVWGGHLIQVLKESPSNERKFLRWKVVFAHISTGDIVFVEKGVGSVPRNIGMGIPANLYICIPPSETSSPRTIRRTPAHPSRTAFDGNTILAHCAAEVIVTLQTPVAVYPANLARQNSFRASKRVATPSKFFIGTPSCSLIPSSI